jgi:hypothetical protein
MAEKCKIAIAVRGINEAVGKPVRYLTQFPITR